MNEIEVAQQESDVPALALQALALASQRARESGRPVVMVVDGELVRVDALGRTLLKTLPQRAKVSARRKRAQS